MIGAIAIGAFLIAGVAAGVRLAIGPSLADRMAALDVMLLSLMGAIAVDAAATGDTTNPEQWTNGAPAEVGCFF